LPIVKFQSFILIACTFGKVIVTWVNIQFPGNGNFQGISSFLLRE